ncbi:hypothetical protein BDDG_03082 [Blastomyces dermatitidis ATCC 18188]|uniref:Uncharacterized protein n=1 Tax=Ajellomyces dermatitidis (strain ATCC 18188 / CBS 674.68) TaxID=653446 RepID=F2TA78_AJEDA|nr:hypothetical protein BDDG_03082 [Blastomyces dermatitidis ATCC 18188]
MGPLHPRPRYMTGHLPSPRMLNCEISKYHSPQMDLKEAVYSLAAAVLYARHSQYVEALEEHTDFLRRSSSLMSRAPVWFNIGSLWASVGDLRRALDAYELSINEDREFTISWFNKGICHFLLREYCESKNTFRKCSSTFRMFSQVKSFDEYSLDFVLVKNDVVWNANVAKRRCQMQMTVCGVDALEPKLRRGHLSLFLGPHKDCFKSNEMFLNKCRSRWKETLSLVPRPSIIRKNSYYKQRKHAYIGFPEMQEGGTKVVLKVPVSRGQSAASHNPQDPQPTANVPELSRFPPVIPRKQVPTASSPSSRRGPSSCDRAAIVNAFPLPPQTLRRRGRTPSPSLVTEQAEVRRNSEAQIPSPFVQPEQTPTRNGTTFPSRGVPIPRSVTDTSFRARLSGANRTPLPAFTFPPPPQPVPSLMQQELPRILNLAVDHDSNDNTYDVNNNTTAVHRHIPSGYSHQLYYPNGLLARSFSTNMTDRDDDCNVTEQHNSGNGPMHRVVDSDRTPEEDNRNDSHTSITTASVEASVSRDSFYSAPEALNNMMSEVMLSPSSSTSCSTSTTNVSRENSYNPRLRRRIFETMLVFLPITQSGAIARSRRRYAGAGRAPVNERLPENDYGGEY